MPDSYESNRRRLDAIKQATDHKNRRGGISNDAWKDLSKKEKKEMQSDGLMPSMGINFMASPGERDKFTSNQEKWENAAYEFGGVSSANDLRDLHGAFKESGIKKMDSFQDGRAFRQDRGDINSQTNKENTPGASTPAQDEDFIGLLPGEETTATIMPAVEEKVSPSQEIIDAKTRVGEYLGEGKDESVTESMFNKAKNTLTGGAETAGEQQTTAQSARTDSDISNTDYTLNLGQFGNQANEGPQVVNNKGKSTTLNLNKGFAPNSEWM